MITDYQIIVGTVQGVEEVVRVAIKEGWQPLGGIAVHVEGEKENEWFSQAMVKESKPVTAPRKEWAEVEGKETLHPEPATVVHNLSPSDLKELAKILEK